MHKISKVEQRVVGIWARHDKIGFKKAYRKLEETRKIFEEAKTAYWGYLQLEVERYEGDVKWANRFVSMESVKRLL